MIVRSEADAYDDPDLRHHQMHRFAVFVQNRDTENFGAAVAMPMIHVRNGIDGSLPGLALASDWPICFSARFSLSAIAARYPESTVSGIADRHGAAVFQPQHPVADRFHIRRRHATQKQ